MVDDKGSTRGRGFVRTARRRHTRLAKALRAKPTPAEAKLWEWLRERRVSGLKFRRQQPIRGFVADFYCDQLGLVIEVDGPVHAEQQRYDQDRDAIMEAIGLTVLRISNEDVMTDLAGVLRRIRQLAGERVNAPSEANE